MSNRNYMMIPENRIMTSLRLARWEMEVLEKCEFFKKVECQIGGRLWNFDGNEVKVFEEGPHPEMLSNFTVLVGKEEVLCKILSYIEREEEQEKAMRIAQTKEKYHV